MQKIFKPKILLLLILFSVLLFLTPGFFDYLEYRKAVAEAQVSSYPWCCGVTKFTNIQTGCSIIQPSGKCSCMMCDGACDGYDEADFTGQEVCNGATYACIQSGTQIKGGGTSLSQASGGQGILCGTTNSMMSSNDLVALPGSGTARNIDRFVNWFDKYIIAGFKQ